MWIYKSYGYMIQYISSLLCNYSSLNISCKVLLYNYYDSIICYSEMILKQNCGRSSGVERNLAKVEVVSSNLIARSNFR